MKYIVWWITEKNFGEEARFESEGLAHLFANMLNGKAVEGGVRFEVTRNDETPVW